jgi:hypothetical protein
MEQRQLRVLRKLVEAGELRQLVANPAAPAVPTEQLPLPFFGQTIDVDGMKDPKCDQITYWGKAVCVFDNVYRCYANVGGTMAIVEITVTRLP